MFQWFIKMFYKKRWMCLMGAYTPFIFKDIVDTSYGSPRSTIEFPADRPISTTSVSQCANQSRSTTLCLLSLCNANLMWRFVDPNLISYIHEEIARYARMVTRKLCEQGDRRMQIYSAMGDNMNEHYLDGEERR
jgi:hypothetical protein